MSKLERDPSAAALDLVDARITDLDRKLIQRLDTLTENVSAIAQFMGKAAEMEIATQHKLDRLSEDIRELTRAIHAQNEAWDRRIDELTRAIHAQNEAWDRRIDRMAEAVQGYQGIAQQQQTTTQELIKLVTVLANKAV